MSTLTNLDIAADHPAYAGHFPGTAVLPGVVLLDAALQVVSSTPVHGWDIAQAKFQGLVRPGEPLTLEHEVFANGTIRFTIRSADRNVATGVFAPRPPHPKIAAVHDGKQS
jgi:3-hydroxyacyl-[acyl-carrier-protein] dehydratase